MAETWGGGREVVESRQERVSDPLGPLIQDDRWALFY